jgi:hypothetical protein
MSGAKTNSLRKRSRLLELTARRGLLPRNNFRKNPQRQGQMIEEETTEEENADV